MAARAKPGDVLLVRMPKGIAYLHFIGRHPEYGDAIIVSAKRDQPLLSVTSDIFSKGYMTFYPVTAAVAKGLVEIIGYIPPPLFPRRLRRAGAMSGARIDTWIVEDGSREIVKTKLSEEELALPIADIWNHEFLVSRIENAWDPTQEGRTP